MLMNKSSPSDTNAEEKESKQNPTVAHMPATRIIYLSSTSNRNKKLAWFSSTPKIKSTVQFGWRTHRVILDCLCECICICVCLRLVLFRLVVLILARTFHFGLLKTVLIISQRALWSLLVFYVPFQVQARAAVTAPAEKCIGPNLVMVSVANDITIKQKTDLKTAKAFQKHFYVWCLVTKGVSNKIKFIDLFVFQWKSCSPWHQLLALSTNQSSRC